MSDPAPRPADARDGDGHPGNPDRSDDLGQRDQRPAAPHADAEDSDSDPEPIEDHQMMLWT
jgi:hypothetical protein